MNTVAFKRLAYVPLSDAALAEMSFDDLDDYDPAEEAEDYDSVVPFIDGISLIEIVLASESRASHGNAHNDYDGLSKPDLLANVSTDTGHWIRDWIQVETDLWAVLACSCQVLECGGVLSRITKTDRTVTWSEFRHSAPDRAAKGWDLSGLGPFTFHRAAYDQAIAHLETL